MRDYGRIYSTFWTSQDVQQLSDDGKLLALYLLSGPHGTLAGVCRLPDGYVCEDLRWTSQRVAKGFAELFRKGFVNRCETSNWVWIRKFLVWNRPENPNQWKAAKKIAAQVPSQCAWKAEFIGVFSAIEAGNNPESLNGCRTLSEPLPTQEQEQEQEQDKETASAGREGKRMNGKARKPVVTTIPPSFAFSDDLRSYVQKNLPDADPDALFEKFCDQAASKAWTNADWRRAFQTYVRNCAPNSGHFAAGQFPRKPQAGKVNWAEF